MAPSLHRTIDGEGERDSPSPDRLQPNTLYFLRGQTSQDQAMARQGVDHHDVRGSYSPNFTHKRSRSRGVVADGFSKTSGYAVEKEQYPVLAARKHSPIQISANLYVKEPPQRRNRAAMATRSLREPLTFEKRSYKWM